MKRKILALVMCAITMFSVVGCSSEKEPTNETQNPSENVGVSSDNSTDNSSELISYFPEEIKLDSSKLVTISNSMKMGSDVISIVLTSGSKDLDSYIAFEMKNAFSFKILTQENNCYAYIDMYSALKESMTTEDLEELKESYAKEIGVDVSEVTDEEFDKALREETMLSGYTDLSLDVETESFDTESIKMLQSSYLDMEQLNSLFSQYDKSSLIFSSNENGVIKATYRVNGYDMPIEVGIDEATKELVYFAFSYEEEGVTCDTSVILSDFNFDNIDTSWTTMDTETSTEDVYEMFYMALMMITMGEVN